METKKVAKIAKKVVLGKNKPTPILRLLCWFTLIWDALVGLYMVTNGLLVSINGNSFSEESMLSDFTQQFSFTYAILHGVSLFSAILMYRLKKNGFILYCVANIAMVVSTFIFVETLQASYIQISFTLVMIGLFATQLRKMS